MQVVTFVATPQTPTEDIRDTLKQLDQIVNKYLDSSPGKTTVCDITDTHTKSASGASTFTRCLVVEHKLS